MELVNNKYVMSGGINPQDLVDKYACPLYVYDGEIMERQYKRITNAFNVKNLKIKYACKALTNINVLKLFKQLGAGLDCVSIHEVQLGLKAGFAAEDIVYTPNCVSLDEIKAVTAMGVHINIDSISMLEQYGQLKNNIPVGIRVNPHIMAGGNYKISTGHIDSKFGISVHQMPHVKRVVEATGLQINGLHMHTGSDILDVEVFLQGAEILLNVAREFKDLDYVDFGSGFKVAYKVGDISTDIEELGKKLTKRFNNFCEEYGKDLSLVFEPGKYLVSESGYFFVKVNVIKQTTASVFVGVDSGLNHLIRPMFYDSYHHILNITNPDEKPRIYNVVGYICETDTFAINRIIPEVLEGDVLCFLNAGAYCFSMASQYNSRPRPAEVMVYKGKDFLIRQRETLEDILRNQIEVELFAETAVEVE